MIEAGDKIMCCLSGRRVTVPKILLMGVRSSWDTDIHFIYPHQKIATDLLATLIGCWFAPTD